jgi:hypothetical protein
VENSKIRNISIANNISLTSIEDSEEIFVKARYDAACKNFLAERQIMSILLKECVEEFKDVDKEAIAKSFKGEMQRGTYPLDANAPSKIVSEGTDSSSLTDGNIYYDFRFTVVVPGSEEQVELIVNVEAQGDTTPGYNLLSRAIYHCGRLISDQKNVVFKGSEFGKIKKVYSIWICLEPPLKHMNSITRYQMTENVIEGNATHDRKYFDLMTIVMIYLGQEYKDEYGGVIGLMTALMCEKLKGSKKKEILEDKYHIGMTEALEKEVSEVGTFSDVIERRSIKRGLERGLEQGLEQGRDNTVLEIVTNLIKETSFDNEKIANLACCDVDFVANRRNQINQLT